MEELSAFDDQCDECPDGEDGDGELASGELAHPLADHRDGPPASASQAAPLLPSLPSPPPRWWVVCSPDGQYMDARALMHTEWSDLYHAGFTLDCHGEGAAGEVRARTALATMRAQIGGGAHAASPVSSPPPNPPNPPSPPPPVVSEAVTAADVGPPGLQSPASPPGAILPRRSHQAARVMIDALRPDVDSPTVIRAALKASGLHRDVCSPRIGGGARGSRTKLTVINEARALFVLPPLADVDPASVSRHQAQYLARQVPMGSAIPPPAADMPSPAAAPLPAERPSEGSSRSAESSPASTDDEGEEDAPSPAASPGSCAAPPTAEAVGEVVDTGEPVGETVTDVSGITVGAVLFEWPSREAFMANGLLMLLLLLTFGVMYVVGGPPPVMAAASSSLVTSGGAVTALARAFARVGAGAGLVAQVTLAASQGAPVQLFAGATSVAWIVHRFFEADG